MASMKNPPAKTVAGDRKKRKKRIIVTVVIVALALALIGGVIAAVVISNREDYRKLAADRKTVATCNGFDIPYEELYFLTMLYKDEMADTYGADIWSDPATAETHRAELEEKVLNNLNENYLILSACRELSIPTDSKEMDTYVNEQMASMLANDFGGKEEAMEEWLEELHMTEHYLRFSIGVEYLHSSVYYTLLDNELFAYGTYNIDEFKDFVRDPDYYARTLQVFIQNEAGEDPAANLAVAQGICDALRAESDPSDRMALMCDYIGSNVNDDYGLVSSDGYYFTKGEMNEIYEEKVFALAVGEVSDPFECTGGYYVVLRLEPETDYINSKVSTLLTNYHGAALGRYVEQFRPDCAVTLNEYGKSIDLLTLE